MADILFLNYDKTNACSFYRSSGIAKHLKKISGHNIVSVSWKEIDMHWATILDFDLIMFQRPYGKPALDLCQYIKDSGVPIWMDYDDNLFCVPEDNKASVIYNPVEVQESIKAILKLADVISVTTDELKQVYIEFNKNIEVIPNAFNDTVFHRGILPPRKKIVAWRGSDTHAFDLLVLGDPINRCVNEFPEWLFYFIGYNPWLLNVIDSAKTSKNKGYLKDMDIIQYFTTCMRLAPSVMHVPLNDGLFNRCKSNISYLEASYFGAVSVVPHWWNVPGALSYDSPESYYNALKSILSGEIDIEIQNKIAWAFIMDTLTLSKVNVKRLQILNSLI